MRLEEGGKNNGECVKKRGEEDGREDRKEDEIALENHRGSC